MLAFRVLPDQKLAFLNGYHISLDVYLKISPSEVRKSPGNAYTLRNIRTSTG